MVHGESLPLFTLFNVTPFLLYFFAQHTKIDACHYAQKMKLMFSEPVV